jgi:hypothetical protein
MVRRKQNCHHVHAAWQWDDRVVQNAQQNQTWSAQMEQPSHGALLSGEQDHGRHGHGAY